MTRRRAFDEERVFEPRRDETAGLALFGDAPAVPRVEMPGAGQAARKDARERVGPTSAEKRHLIALCIEAHGPLNRTEIHEITKMPKDSVNGRVREACLLPEGHEDRMYTEGARDGQSLVHLFRLRTP